MEDDGDTGGRFYVEIHKANNMTFEFACEAGVVLIFSKYQGDYSEKNVLSFLNMMALLFSRNSSHSIHRTPHLKYSLKEFNVLDDALLPN